MPYPKAGESEQDYVSRFMASAEARKDYPDEKQRAAVAYSMFKERKNASTHELAAVWDRLSADDVEDLLGHGRFTVDVQSGKPYPFIRQPADVQREFKASYEDAHENANAEPADKFCPSCGAGEMRAMANGIPGVECPQCGHEVRGAMAAAAPMPLSPDACPGCTHSLENDHDAIGCNAEDCACTRTNAEKKNAGGFNDNKVRVYSMDDDQFMPPTFDTVDQAKHYCQVKQITGVIYQGNKSVGTITPMGMMKNTDQDAVERVAMEDFEAHVAGCSTCSAEYASASPDPARLCADGVKLVRRANENAIVDIKAHHWDRMTVDNRRRLLEDLGQKADPTLRFSQLPPSVQSYIEDSAMDTKHYGLENAGGKPATNEDILAHMSECPTCLGRNPKVKCPVYEKMLDSFVHGKPYERKNADGTVEVPEKHLADDAGDLAEITRHAEGIEHEVGEMQAEDADIENALNPKVVRDAEDDFSIVVKGKKVREGLHADEIAGALAEVKAEYAEAENAGNLFSVGDAVKHRDTGRKGVVSKLGDAAKKPYRLAVRWEGASADEDVDPGTIAIENGEHMNSAPETIADRLAAGQARYGSRA